MISKIWNFISQISGVYGTFVLTIGGTIWLINLIEGLKLSILWFVALTIIVLIVFFSSIVFFIKQNKFFIQEIRKFFLEKEAQMNVSKFTNKANASPQTLTLPNANHLKNLRKIAKEEAKNWMSDSTENSIVVRIEKQNRKFSIKAQDVFFSTWKNQRLDVFVGEEISFYKQEIDNFDDTTYHEPFYEKYKDWDKAVLQAYKKIENKINLLDYQLNLHSHFPVFHFDFIYREGDVVKDISFDFDGNYLISKNGDKFKIA